MLKLKEITKNISNTFVLLFNPNKSINGKSSFNLVKYYSIISLFFVLIASISLGSLYKYVASQNLIESEEANNIKLTRFYSSTLWNDNFTLFDSLRGKTGDEIRNNKSIQDLLLKTYAQLKNTTLLKIKVYNIDGLTLFSTDPKQIGSNKSNYPGFIDSKKGKVVSKVSFRDRFYSVDNELQNREVLSSYIPVYDKNGEINGVFELYSDITPLVNKITSTQRQVIAGVILIMAVLYFLLLLIMIRANNTLKEHEKLQKAVEKKIQHQAHHDPLTGLPNRLYFHNLLDNYMRKADNNEYLLGLLFIDLDHFKSINDRYGHNNGDLYLQEVADRLHHCCRESDVAARLSGDEFVVILDQVKHVDVVDTSVNRLIEKVAKPINLDGEEVNCSISVGVSIYPFSELSHEEFLKSADCAMYEAKESGRNNYRYFSYTYNQQKKERSNRVAEIKTAIGNNQFEIYYQPKINLKSGAIVGVEALIRWNHPNHGLLSPIEFIPLAEDTGDIIEIGRYVFNKACKDIDSLPHDISLAINLSIRQFEDPNLLEHLKTAASQVKLSLSDIEIELTESILMQDVGESINLLTEMKALGLKIALDDFGTGYSSLSYLRKFPIDIVKVDKSFIQDIDEDDDAFALTSAITDLAHQLNMEVVAEGVETTSHLAKLRQCNVDEVQGFLFSKPINFDNLSRLLNDDSAGRLLRKIS